MLVTNGAQQALDLVGRVLIEPGDLRGGRGAGLPAGAAAVRSLGARVVGVPVDEEGLDVAAHAGARARLVYVTPSHQFPLGTRDVAGPAARRCWSGPSGAAPR